MINTNHKYQSFLNARVVLNFIFFFVIFSIILLGNQLYLVLSKSLNTGIYLTEVMPLIFMKYIRDLPFTISLSFCLALTYTLQKLYKLSELIILYNAGIGDKKLYQMISPVIIFITLITLVLSTHFSPLAIKSINNIKENASSRPEYIFFKEGVFQNFQNKKIIFFSPIIESKDENQIMKDVFVLSKEDGRLILADSAKKIFNETTGSVYLSLFDGKIYKNLGQSIDSVNTIISTFKKFDLLLFDPSSVDIELNPLTFESMNLIKLIDSNEPRSVVEFFYRFSVPLALLIIRLMSIQLSRVNPRNTKNFSIGYVLLGYVSYYNMLLNYREIKDVDTSQAFLYFLVPHMLFGLIIYIIHSLRK